MNVEEITKKLEEIRADAFERASSHDEQSKTQLEDYNRVELDEDVAGEDVKLERTKGKDFPTPKTLSRATSMDGGKGPKEDIYVNDATLKAPSIDELQNKLDSLKKNERKTGRLTRGRITENPDSPLSIDRRKNESEEDKDDDYLDDIFAGIFETFLQDMDINLNKQIKAGSSQFALSRGILEFAKTVKLLGENLQAGRLANQKQRINLK
tara:strand:+ start:628 stop:1257 length:630 start_codon:yes stop_codon:yes gene_type:complete